MTHISSDNIQANNALQLLVGYFFSKYFINL